MAKPKVNSRLHDTPGAVRPRNAAATRRALIDAALELFAREAYDQVGVRAIADKAGVNQALLNRYFGGKAGLFAAAVGEMFTEPAILSAARADFGREIVGYLFSKPDAAAIGPLGILMRASSNDEAAAILKDAMERSVLAGFSAFFSGPEAQAKATAVVALLLGLSILRWSLGTTAAAVEACSAEAGYFARLIQSIVDEKV